MNERETFGGVMEMSEKDSRLVCLEEFRHSRAARQLMY